MRRRAIMFPHSRCKENLMRMLLPVAAVFLLSAQTCKTSAPTSDSSIPTLEWVVTNKSSGPAHNTQVRINGSGTVNAKRGEEYAVTLNARDPEGIRKITLGGAGSYGCQGGGIGQNTDFHQVTDQQLLAPNAANEVLTQIFLLRNVGFTGLNCQNGLTFSGGNLQLYGMGENYFSGKATGTLTFSISP
jgi:hypothetical protein